MNSDSGGFGLPKQASFLLRYTVLMQKKKLPKQDEQLKAFIKSGGRTDAEADFNVLLQKAVRPSKVSKPAKKSK